MRLQAHFKQSATTARLETAEMSEDKMVSEQFDTIANINKKSTLQVMR